jgi:hypothetical protein
MVVSLTFTGRTILLASTSRGGNCISNCERKSGLLNSFFNLLVFLSKIVG